MRELNKDEARIASGGEDTNYNELACNTAVAATVAATGLAAGGEAMSAAGVLGIPGTEICQVTTTYIGSAIGNSIAGAEESFDEFSSQLSYAWGAFEQYLMWGNLGL